MQKSAPFPPPVYLQYGKAIKETIIAETNPKTSIILKDTLLITETLVILFFAIYSLTSFETTTGTAPIQTELNGTNKLYAIAKYPLPVAPIRDVKGILYKTVITLTSTVDTIRIKAFEV